VLYLRAALGLVFPLVVDVAVPAMLLADGSARFGLGSVRFAALPLIVGGGWLLLDSVFVRFAREGKGTLVPIDPPRFVVRGGAYRVTRNPMYVANVAVLVGTAIVFGSWGVLAWAGVMSATFAAFVLLYEEPTLLELFGDDYRQYQRQVGRWLPRVRRPSR
jgi:protein-S-isoprenylcysteine O-methyltransferase Ste14